MQMGGMKLSEIHFDVTLADSPSPRPSPARGEGEFEPDGIVSITAAEQGGD
jgi:hypothetical protein